MAQQKLNAPSVRPGFQQMHSIGVAKGMGTYGLLQASALPGPTNGIADRIPA